MLLFILLLTFIGLSAGLAWFLIGHDHGSKEPINTLWIAAGLGLAGAVMAGFIENQLVNSDNLLTGMPAGAMLSTAMVIGAVEEACKFLPLAAYIYKKPFFNEHTDGVIYFALAGLGFGLPENVLYTLQFGSSAGFVRLLLTPLFHAAATGMVGYFLVRGKLGGRGPWRAAVALLAAAVLHGLYDFGLSSGSRAYSLGALTITLGLSAALFVLFLKATEHDQEMGASAIGHNSFCRSCGWANPHHYLYCVHCGKNA